MGSDIPESAPPRSLGCFDHQPRTRLVFGNGVLNRVGELAWELGGKRVLLVTDSGIVEAGHANRARQSLLAAGLEVATFDQVRENPTTVDVARCVEAAKSHRTDLLIGLGGGSSMDTAKGCNFIYTNGGEMKQYQGVGKATRPMVPLIAIPTTAGTGSECQSAALIADEETRLKMACLDPKAAARVAILDPSLTLSQPRAVAACTGVDALAHAVETAVTNKRNPVSAMFSREAFSLCIGSLPQIFARPNDLQARERMLLGAAYAGAAIENSMLGAAHSAANPLTARYPIIHGQAVGLMLPHVVRFNSREPAAAECYAALATDSGLVDAKATPREAIEGLIARIESILNLAGMPRSLEECGVDREAIPELAAEAAAQWTARFNPRPVEAADFVKLYEAAFEPRVDTPDSIDEQSR